MLSLKKTVKESNKKKRVMFNSNSKRRRKKTQQADTEAIELTKQINSAQGIEIIKKMNHVHIKNQISKFYHTNFAGYLDKETVSKEQWQQKTTSKKEQIDLVTYRNNFEIILSLNTTIAYTLTIWLANVQFFFGANQDSFLSSNFYILPLITVIFDFILTGQLKKVISNFEFKEALPKILKIAISIIYLSLKINENFISRSPEWLFLEVPCIYFFYTRASQLYKSFRVMSLSKSYQYHFKAFDLIFSLVIVAHLIAIILFLVGQNSKQNVTWVTQTHIDQANSLIKYIYAFYFGCTTILTVGYGDIHPQNHIEVIVVCFIEIFGVATFGYLLSQIGYNLSILRKDREILEKDLAVLDKCRQYYKIQPDLVIKARSKLLNSQQSSDRLKPEEEKELMMKFNEPLRQELISSNALSVIKSSIFFICRWSKQFQNVLALSLNTALYSPGEEFLQTPGNEKIYIIRLGKIDFYRKKKGGNQDSRKIIQSLKIDLNTEVSNNSFGYTAVLGTKPTGLEIISRDFTSAYYIQKKVFDNLSKEANEDFEYCFEIKDKIEQSRFPESLEVPVLTSRKYHYNPSRIYLIKRRHKENQFLTNERAEFERGNFRKATKIKAAELVNIPKEEMTQIRKMIITSYDQISLKSIKDPKSQHSIKLLASLKSLQDESLKNNDIEKPQQMEKQKKEVQEKHFLIETKIPKMSTKKYQDNAFDRAKQFSNFYPRQNCEVILEKLERYNFSYSKQQYEDDSRTIRTEIFPFSRT